MCQTQNGSQIKRHELDYRGERTRSGVFIIITGSRVSLSKAMYTLQLNTVGVTLLSAVSCVI